jgi:hypothetical protein
MGTGHKHKEEPNEDSDEDEIWNGMETVGGRRTQTKRELLNLLPVINPPELLSFCIIIGRKNSKSHTQNKIQRTS